MIFRADAPLAPGFHIHHTLEWSHRRKSPWHGRVPPFEFFPVRSRSVLWLSSISRVHVHPLRWDDGNALVRRPVPRTLAVHVEPTHEIDLNLSRAP